MRPKFFVGVSLFSLALSAHSLVAEETATESKAGQAFTAPQRKTRQSLTIVSSADRSGLEIGESMQNGLGHLFEETGRFSVFRSKYALPGYTEDVLSDAFRGLSTELIALVYLESARLSIFLFDGSHRGGFLVASRPLFAGGANEQPSAAQLRETLQQAFRELLANYDAGRFQWLPDEKTQAASNASRGAAEPAPEQGPNDRASEARRLFLAVSAIEDRPFYLGANLGVVRLSGSGTTSSTVSFGVYAGYRLSQQLSLEAGADIFSFALGQLDMRYRIPIGGKFVSLSLCGGGGMVLGAVTTSQGLGGTQLTSFKPMPDAGFSFEIPLLGTMMRGEVRLYALGGSGESILLGTYGLAYAL